MLASVLFKKDCQLQSIYKSSSLLSSFSSLCVVTSPMLVPIWCHSGGYSLHWCHTGVTPVSLWSLLLAPVSLRCLLLTPVSLRCLLLIPVSLRCLLLTPVSSIPYFKAEKWNNKSSSTSLKHDTYYCVSFQKSIIT